MASADFSVPVPARCPVVAIVATGLGDLPR